ncbi:MAG: exodeoxyribonuclease VII small subunit [Marinifilaceae bacterium]|jgi:exodeoxyribonuclease VII small subunit|nr:exonuclease VII small subunit [Marinilabiliaceae bacterium JC040]MCT4599804.1 exodeoxyribonuclease VII small subunit [Marinifilaceae bacterium]
MVQKKFDLEELTYEKAVDEIKTSIQRLKEDEVNVDELASLVKRISYLLKFCKEKIVLTQNEVDEVLEQLEDE